MNAGSNLPEAGGWSSIEREPPSLRVPANAIELVEFRSTSIEHRLGYYRDQPFVIFGYCPGGGEVIWRDGRSSGFGTGGWKVFLEEIAPLAAQYGARIGNLTSVGTHVILMDRNRAAVYAVPRESAEEFLSRVYGLPRRTRRCLCALMDCDACPLRAGCMAGSDGQISKRAHELHSESISTGGMNTEQLRARLLAIPRQVPIEKAP